MGKDRQQPPQQRVKGSRGAAHASKAADLLLASTNAVGPTQLAASFQHLLIQTPSNLPPQSSGGDGHLGDTTVSAFNYPDTGDQQHSGEDRSKMSNLTLALATDLTAAPPALQVIFKKIIKPNLITKVKGLEELSLYLSDTINMDTTVHSYWVKVFTRMASHHDRKVRTLIQTCHSHFIRLDRKAFAPHLKSIIGSWMLCWFDPVEEIAKAARSSFDVCFPMPERALKAILFCLIPILQFCHGILCKITSVPSHFIDDAASRDEVLEVEEWMCSRALDCIAHLCEHVPADSFLEAIQKSGLVLDDALVLESSKNGPERSQWSLWSISADSRGGVRRSFYNMLKQILLHVPQLAEHQSQLICHHFFESAFLESEPRNMSALWDALLLCSRKFPDYCWSIPSTDDALLSPGVMPTFYSFLAKGFSDSAEISYPCLLPLIAQIPKPIREAHSKQILVHIWKGLKSLSKSQLNLLLSAFFECLFFLCEGVHVLIAEFQQIPDASSRRDRKTEWLGLFMLPFEAYFSGKLNDTAQKVVLVNMNRVISIFGVDDRMTFYKYLSAKLLLECIDGSIVISSWFSLKLPLFKAFWSIASTSFPEYPVFGEAIVFDLVNLPSQSVFVQETDNLSCIISLIGVIFDSDNLDLTRIGPVVRNFMAERFSVDALGTLNYSESFTSLLFILSKLSIAANDQDELIESSFYSVLDFLGDMNLGECNYETGSFTLKRKIRPLRPSTRWMDKLMRNVVEDTSRSWTHAERAFIFSAIQSLSPDSKAASLTQRWISDTAIESLFSKLCTFWSSSHDRRWLDLLQECLSHNIAIPDRYSSQLLIEILVHSQNPSELLQSRGGTNMLSQQNVLLSVSKFRALFLSGDLGVDEFKEKIETLIKPLSTISVEIVDLALLSSVGVADYWDELLSEWPLTTGSRLFIDATLNLHLSLLSTVIENYNLCDKIAETIRWRWAARILVYAEYLFHQKILMALDGEDICISRLVDRLFRQSVLRSVSVDWHKNTCEKLWSLIAGEDQPPIPESADILFYLLAEFVQVGGVYSGLLKRILQMANEDGTDVAEYWASLACRAVCAPLSKVTDNKPGFAFATVNALSGFDFDAKSCIAKIISSNGKLARPDSFATLSQFILIQIERDANSLNDLVASIVSFVRRYCAGSDRISASAPWRFQVLDSLLQSHAWVPSPPEEKWTVEELEYLIKQLFGRKEEAEGAMCHISPLARFVITLFKAAGNSPDLFRFTVDRKEGIVAALYSKFLTCTVNDDELLSLLPLMEEGKEMEHIVRLPDFNSLVSRLASCNIEVLRMAGIHLETLVNAEVYNASLRVEMATSDGWETISPDLFSFVDSYPPQVLTACTLSMRKLSHSSLKVVGYLMAWILILRHFENTTFQLRAQYFTSLSSSASFTSFLEHLSHFILTSQSSGFDFGLWELEELDFNGLSESDIVVQLLSGHLYFLCLKSVPSLVRNWFAIVCKDRNVTSQMEKLTQRVFSPLCIKREMNAMTDASATRSEMSSLEVRVDRANATIVASYRIEESCLEMQLFIPPTFPLRQVTVQPGAKGKLLGVSEGKWRTWLLSVTALIVGQNGSIMDALVLFEKNLSHHFESVEECAICYAVISAMDHSLPSKTCRTCKHVFHGSCLFKWFKSSHGSTCPLCRQEF